MNARRLFGPLWVLWAGLLFGGMVLHAFEHIGSSGFLKATRLTSSIVLVAAAFLWWRQGRQGRAGAALAWIAVGMAFGFLGDVSNAQVVVRDPKMALMGGAMLFAIGHVAYIWAALRIQRDLAFGWPARFWLSLAFWEGVGLAAWYLVVYGAEPREAIHWIGLPYTLLLAGTAGVTTALAMSDRRFVLLGLGGVLFLLSDLVLALGQFRKEIDLARLLVDATGWTTTAGVDFFEQVARNSVWILYGPAQMMIVYSGACILSAYGQAKR